MRSSDFFEGLFDALERHAAEIEATRDYFGAYFASDLRTAISKKVFDDRMVDALVQLFSSVFFEMAQRRHDELMQVSKLISLARAIEAGEEESHA